MPSLSSDGGLTGLGDQCFYGCGHDSTWRFRCSACSGPQQQAVEFVVCDECRPRTKCIHCGQEAEEDCFRADSDQLTASASAALTQHVSETSFASCIRPPTNSLALSVENCADMVEQLRNVATTLENLAPHPDLCRQIASTHAKAELNNQLRRILRRPIQSSDVVYNTLSENGQFRSEVIASGLCGALQNGPFACKGSPCSSRKDAERSAALAMLSQLQ